MQKRVLVTGANGFLGTHLVRFLAGEGCAVIAAARCPMEWGVDDGDISSVMVRDWQQEGEWRKLLSGVDAVIHLAARVHVLDERAGDPLAECIKINVAYTKVLAEAAVRAGVKRFIYLSTIKVLGEGGSPSDRGLAEDAPPAPMDPYAHSKMEAERVVREACDGAGLDYVVIRPPLVYGPGVKANFLRLLHLVKKRTPLPFASVDNRRSLVGIDNLVDFIYCAITHPAAANQTFHVADNAPLSTAALIEKIGECLGVHPRLLPVPPALLRLASMVIGRTADMERLCGSLVVDIGKARRVLGWQPPLSTEEELRKTVGWYLAGGRATGKGTMHV